MSRDDVIATLREHEAELRAAGVVHLHLHGSYARQTQVEALSDVDLIAEFKPTRRYTLIDMVRLENRLRDWHRAADTAGAGSCRQSDPPKVASMLAVWAIPSLPSDPSHPRGDA
jgi:predicted nucleotidyltransferase